MTKNPKTRVFTSSFFGVFFFWGGGGGGGLRLGQCRAGESVGRGVGAIIFICVIEYQPNTHCFKFPSRYSIGLPSYGLRKSSLKNYQRDVTKNK